MERVETLLKKLQEQFNQNASPPQLLITVQMLHSELMHLQTGTATAMANNPVAITIAQNTLSNTVSEKENIITNKKEEEKIVEILQVDEAEIDAELEEMKRNAEMIQKISVQNKPSIMFEMEEDIPTLALQQKATPAKEINEMVSKPSASLNEKLKQSKIDLGDTLTEAPIKDLRKAIGVNDRFLFINDLFRGDEANYERSLKTINSFSILAEAEYWIQRELKLKNGWKENDEVVKQFIQLVRRRFS